MGGCIVMDGEKGRKRGKGIDDNRVEKGETRVIYLFSFRCVIVFGSNYAFVMTTITSEIVIVLTAMTATLPAKYDTPHRTRRMTTGRNANPPSERFYLSQSAIALKAHRSWNRTALDCQRPLTLFPTVCDVNGGKGEEWDQTEHQKSTARPY
jgi:hypothetical protein